MCFKKNFDFTWEKLLLQNIRLSIQKVKLINSKYRKKQILSKQVLREVLNHPNKLVYNFVIVLLFSWFRNFELI